MVEISYSVTITDGGTLTARLGGSVGDRPFADAEIEHLHEVVRTSLARSLQAEVDLELVRGLIAQMALPEEAPRLARLVCSDTGEVWVQHALPVLQVGPGVTRVGSPEAWESSVWDVFDLESHSVRSVHVPDGGRITRVTSHIVVGFTIDDSGQEAPARWRRP